MHFWQDGWHMTGWHFMWMVLWWVLILAGVIWVIGKRVADAVRLQDDMELMGVSDISADWRMKMAARKGIPVYSVNEEAAHSMGKSGLDTFGRLEDLMERSDVMVDCAPKKLGAKNAEMYRTAGVRFILQGGEKHEITGLSFVAEANYESAIGARAARVVSCNTTSAIGP